MPGDKPAEEDWSRMLQAAEFSKALAEREQATRQQTRCMLLDCLDILDSLERLAASPGLTEHNGLAAVRKQLAGTLERAGVRFSHSTGQPFDPHKHEAVGT